MAESSTAMLPLSTPSISTNSDVVPFELVTVQAGPGEAQPGGVRPGGSQRLAEPPETVVVIPGANLLAAKDADAVWLAVISVIRTTRGVQATLGFQETGELVIDMAAAIGPLAAESRRIDEIGIVRAIMRTGRIRL